MDVAEIVLEKPLKLARWLNISTRVATQFVDLFKDHSNIDVRQEVVGEMTAIIKNDNLGFILSHPLWHPVEGHFQPQQNDAKLALRALSGSDIETKFLDVRKFGLRPAKHFFEMRNWND